MDESLEIADPLESDPGHEVSNQYARNGVQRQKKTNDDEMIKSFVDWQKNVFPKIINDPMLRYESNLPIDTKNNIYADVTTGVVLENVSALFCTAADRCAFLCDLKLSRPELEWVPIFKVW